VILPLYNGAQGQELSDLTYSHWAIVG
jgi:hypothetical protein